MLEDFVVTSTNTSRSSKATEPMSSCVATAATTATVRHPAADDDTTELVVVILTANTEFTTISKQKQRPMTTNRVGTYLPPHTTCNPKPPKSIKISHQNKLGRGTPSAASAGPFEPR